MSRSVFAGFYAVAAVGAVVLVAAFLLARGPERRARLWRRLSRTGIVVVAVTIVGGLAGILFFDQAFELFHELFFPAGSYLFDPATEKLVQLFPQAFWIDSTIGVGAVVVALATGLWWLGAAARDGAGGSRRLRYRTRGRPRPGGGAVSGGLPIARLFGIEIRVSLAWSVLIAVVTVIGAQQAAAGAPQLASVAHILVGALVALGFLASVVAHELAHALVGRRRGVEARTIVLGFAGGLAPLSIEAGRPGDEFAIAIAGPFVSLAIALLAIPVAMLAGGTGTILTVIAGGVARDRRPQPRARAAQPAPRAAARRRPGRAGDRLVAGPTTATGPAGSPPGPGGSWAGRRWASASPSRSWTGSPRAC